MTTAAGKAGRAHRLVLSPQEPLTAGGPAEELERQIQETFKAGYEHVVIDLRGVPTADSGGIRALVRGHTSAQRLNRRFTLVSPNPRVKELLELSLLTRVLEVVDSLVEAKTRLIPWDRIWTGIAVAMVGLALVGLGITYPDLGLSSDPGTPGILQRADQAAGGVAFDHPLFELAKLIAAAVIGMLVTIVHRQYRVGAERQSNPTMDQAQVLLCVSGAMMMIIIGNNLARAFGIAGAASIIRFRTPVEDARDITVLFLLMGLGMAAGLGALAVAGLGTLFLCALIPILNLFSSERPRTMMVEIVAEERDFPMAHVHHVFAVNGILFEPREVSQGDEATAKYLTTLKPTDSLEDLSAQLMGDGKKGIKNVSWSPPKRG
ncbi:MAG TPA: STAS domain-containing protein [Vicinamibacterales bacterium]|nr:STAS domain-containing protein [Vicinamibacterales bacterium]